MEFKLRSFIIFPVRGSQCLSFNDSHKIVYKNKRLAKITYLHHSLPPHYWYLWDKLAKNYTKLGLNVLKIHYLEEAPILGHRFLNVKVKLS